LQANGDVAPEVTSVIVETTSELLAALKELTEMTTSNVDKLSFMQ
jgi:hypothetical protein